MSIGRIIACVLLAIAIVVLVFNTDMMDLKLIVKVVPVMKAIAMFVFMGLGVVIGILLK
jgi:hypothetical protein